MKLSNRLTMSRIFCAILLLTLAGCAAELVETDADRINGRFSLTAVNEAPLPVTLSASPAETILVTEGSLFLDTIREFTLQYRYTVSGQSELALYTGKWSTSDGRLTLRNEAGLSIFPDNEASDSLIVIRSTYGSSEPVPFVLTFER